MNYLHTIITLAKVVPQVLEGLSYLHSIGILHGDLKNKNIMVYEDRASNPTRDIVQAKLKVTLIDFDLSELFTREQNIPIAPRYKALTNSRNAICRVDNEEILDVFKAMVYYKEYVEKGYKKEEQIHAFVNGMTPKIKAHTPSANQNEVAAALNSLTYLLKAAHTLTYDLYQCDAAIRASKGLMPTKLIPQHIVDYYNKNRSIL
ncbi:hypothetical protein BDF22DRAFT_488867 [Syncephalis plumigaleata]|nr:hypothetical protein BDF22DRAFT_488867 [Syncephalis plumigaleata]